MPGDMLPGTDEERSKQSRFWVKLQDAAVQNTMMLDERSVDLDAEERPEILSYLPKTHKETDTILELGAGIGRMSLELSQHCKHLTTLDFVETFVQEARKRLSHLDHVDFLCMDATKLECDAASMTLVFSNWLFMYLNDAEVEAMARRMIEWTQMGGHVFFRESCFHPSGNVKPTGENPTHYRDPAWYKKTFEDVRDSKGNRFEMMLHTNVKAYERLKNNPNQFVFLYKKVSA